jgi:hypothetical protein
MTSALCQGKGADNRQLPDFWRLELEKCWRFSQRLEVDKVGPLGKFYCTSMYK